LEVELQVHRHALRYLAAEDPEVVEDSLERLVPALPRAAEEVGDPQDKGWRGPHQESWS
jgi:hypothetical protein